MIYPPVVVVDEYDNVVGEAPLLEARQKKLIYRVVFVVGEDAQGRLLLQRRSKNLKLFPDCWDSTASGHVDDGHSYEQAARQELEEEIGIHDAPLEEIAHFYTETPEVEGFHARRYAKIFRIPLYETPYNFMDGEVSEVRWFTRDEIAQLLEDHPDKAAEGLQHIWRYVLHENHSHQATS